MIGTGQDQRVVLSAALDPPSGYTLDRGVILTYSLDLITLMTLPAHIVLGGDATREELLARPAALLDALHRVRERLLVFCHQGAMHAPARGQLLFSLLEPMIREVQALHAGAFHPKVWLLRFLPEDPAARPCLRLVVGSRNLTLDRSWDLAATLEGEVSAAPPRTAQPSPLAELVAWLAGQASTSEQERGWLAALGQEVRGVRWQVPAPWDSVEVEVLGLGPAPRAWSPPFAHQGGADALVVISPFLDAQTLGWLAKHTKAAPIVIATPEALDALPREARDALGQGLHLKESCVAELDEEGDAGLAQLSGLHAKAFFAQAGERTELVLGSANATRRAMLHGGNVEVGVRLRGLRHKTGAPASLLDPDEGIGELLAQWSPTLAAPPNDPGEALAAEQLDWLRALIANAALHLRCEALAEGGYQLTLYADTALAWPADARVSCWPVTVDRAHHIAPLRQEATGAIAVMGVGAMEQLTCLIAFELVLQGEARPVRFVRNLPIEGLPAQRQGALLATLLNGREGFLAYLRYVLGELGSEVPEAGALRRGQVLAQGRGEAAMPALLETLLRTLALDPARLLTVRALLTTLEQSAQGAALIPEAFYRVWAAIEPHLPAPQEAP